MGSPRCQPFSIRKSICQKHGPHFLSTLRLPACILAVLLQPSISAAQAFRVTDLGTFAGGSVSQGQALTNCGQVVGYARFADFDAHGFLWDQERGLHDLGAIAPQHNFSVAQAINSSGVVAGYSTFDYPPNLDSHAVLWMNGGIFDLGTLPGSNDAQAMGINDRGEVVGFSVPHAFLWTAQTGMEDLGALPGGYSQALAINNREQVTGFSNNARGNWQAFVWTRSGGMQALPYRTSRDDSASGNAINAKGEIAGASGGGFTSIAVMWHADHQTVETLGVLPGQGWSAAFAINDHSEVVGWSGFVAFLWTHKNGMQILNDLIPKNSGWTLSLPIGINDRGQITGQGTINGQQHGFLLTPVGETPGCE